MALNPSSSFPTQTQPATAGYPYGSAQNITVPGDNSGTPWTKLILDDIWGFQQALLNAAGIVPNGSPDQVGASQYLAAVNALIMAGGGGNTFPGPNPDLVDNGSAIIIGTATPATADHIAMGPSVIQAKSNTTTPSIMRIQNEGGGLTLGQRSGAANTYVEILNNQITPDLSEIVVNYRRRIEIFNLTGSFSSPTARFGDPDIDESLKIQRSGGVLERVLTVSDLPAASTVENLILAADVSSPSSAVVPVPGLSFSVSANSIYRVTGLLKSETLNVGALLTFDSTAIAGSEIDGLFVLVHGSTVVAASDPLIGVLTLTIPTVAVGFSAISVNFTVITGANAGTVSCTFHQTANNPTPVLLKTNSSLTITKIQ